MGTRRRVLTTPLSFVASSNCLLFEDARPVFCDVDPATLTIDPALVGDAVGEATAGILPVHIFGFPAAMEEIEAIASAGRLGLIEDAAQALGAVCADGRQAGARGNPAAFAFYANKQMTTGEGGMLVSGSPAAAEVARSERNQGRAPTMKFMDHERLGFNYRLTDIQAALGVAQLERLDGMLAARAALAARYSERFAAIGAAEPGAGDPDDLVLPLADRGAERRSWFVYVLRLPKSVDRDHVIAELDRRGIDARPYLPCIHLSGFFRERFGTRRASSRSPRTSRAARWRCRSTRRSRSRRSSASSPSSARSSVADRLSPAVHRLPPCLASSRNPIPSSGS